jgi:hypothetical protein
VVGWRDQLPGRLSPATYLDLDRTIPLASGSQLVDDTVDIDLPRPVPHATTSHAPAEAYDGPATAEGAGSDAEEFSQGPGDACRRTDQ